MTSVRRPGVAGRRRSEARQFVSKGPLAVNRHCRRGLSSSLLLLRIAFSSQSEHQGRYILEIADGVQQGQAAVSLLDKLCCECEVRGES